MIGASEPPQSITSCLFTIKRYYNDPHITEEIKRK
jgi:hypothetical protein